MVLKVFPRLYDPLGLLLPFSMRARIFFSEVSKRVKTWDDPLVDTSEWKKWLEETEQLSLVKVPHCVKTATSPNSVQLHVFGDASSSAYGAAAYVCCVYKKEVSCCLVAAKAHVAPAAFSIPRLELLGAELATRLAKKVKSVLKLNIDSVFYWSDSLNVLYWIRNDHQHLQMFVAHCVAKIRRMTDVEDWRWIPTDQNPADMPTRGVSPVALSQSSLWWHGPKFLNLVKLELLESPRLLPTSDILK